MQELTLAKTAAWLKECEDAYILIHRSPDGDCIGAGYALAEMLHQLGKRAVVLCNDEIPKRYQFMLPEEDGLSILRRLRAGLRAELEMEGYSV